MNPVLSLLTGKNIEDPRLVIMQGFAGKSSETANCKMKVSTAFSICDGTILSIDKSDTWCVTIDMGVSHWIRYQNLSSTGVLVGQRIHKGDFIGYGDKGFIRLEYCTGEKSNYPVRLKGFQLYKHDPTPILFAKED